MSSKVKARTKETQSEERSEAEALRELMEETRAVLESEAGEAFGRKAGRSLTLTRAFGLSLFRSGTGYRSGRASRRPARLTP